MAALCPHCHNRPSMSDFTMRQIVGSQGSLAMLACSKCSKSSYILEWLGDLPKGVAAQQVREHIEHQYQDQVWRESSSNMPDKEKDVANYFLNIMRRMGLNPEEEGLKETPARVASFLMEFNQPTNLVNILKAFSHEDSIPGSMPMVIQTQIPLAALCEHHFCPFFGTVDIGYIPNNKVVGLSKLTRVVAAAGRQRPSIQERITNEIADAVDVALNPKGVIVVARATHTCMSVRGIATPGVETTTSAVRGNYVHVPAARQEFLELIRR